MTQHDSHGILFDHARRARIGLPEAVFCQGKSRDALLALLEGPGLNTDRPVLFTRLDPALFACLPPEIQEAYKWHPLSGVAFAACLPPRPIGKVAVVSAGTADGRTTWEAAKTLEYLGISHDVYEDNGVAGLWRLTSNLEALAAYDTLIVVAGLDAALASVMGGLTGKPLFAVPTSVGYGMAKSGEAALASMLVSCAPGIGVLNIDNGYGAACAAARVIHLLQSRIAP
jgi:NCAIR mutase (PurE)-related protein